MKLALVLSSILQSAILLGVLNTSSGALAQNVLSVTDDSALGGFATVDILLNARDDIQGWSFGLCNSPEVEVESIFDGAATLALNGGAGPDFNQVNVFSSGWTVGIVVSFFGVDSLPPGSDHELHRAEYSARPVTFGDPCGGGGPGTLVSLDFCETLGAPPVATVIVSSGASIVPDQVSGSISVLGSPPIPPFEYFASHEDLYYLPRDGTGFASAEFSIVQNDVGGAFPIDTLGFAMGNQCDANFIQPTSVVPAGELALINAGAGPDFFGVDTFANGWTAAVLYAFLGGVFIQYDSIKIVVEVEYQSVESRLQGDLNGGVSALDWVDTLGTPPVPNTISIGSSSAVTCGTAGSISLFPIVQISFIRGDCNDDQLTDVADGIWILNRLFFSGPTADCEDACDANSDGMLDSSDATFLFNYQFLAGPAPAPPFPDCGPAAMPVGLSCDTSTCTP